MTTILSRFTPMTQRLECVDPTTGVHVLYDCEICGGLHPWSWDNDCRDNLNRYPDEETYARCHDLTDPNLIEVRTMEDRLAG
jgi:hypothetical protein